MNLRRKMIPVICGTLSVLGCGGSDPSPPSDSASGSSNLGGSPSATGSGGATAGAPDSGGAATVGGSTADGGTSTTPVTGGSGAMAGNSMAGSEAVAGANSTGGADPTGGGSSIGGAGGGGGSAGGAAAGSGGAFSGVSYPYIFSNFNDAAALSSLMIYTSNDALNWTLLLDTKFTGPTGFMRDPSIMRHTDGKYYVAFTTPPTLSCCGDEQSFSVASSSNLKNWTTVATIPCGVAGTKNTWAPEWFIDTDGTVHVIVTLDLKSYRYEPTDATLTKWGPGKFIGLSGTIDTQIIKIGTTYHAIIPSRHGTASSLDGPWTIANNAPQCKEAPAVVHISGDTWRYYCDDGGSGHEKSSLTMDAFKTFSALQTLPVVGNDISHGTVIRGDTGHPF